MKCKNCEATIDGNFCSNCGQNASVHRVTFKHVIHEFFHAFTHADKGFLLLIKRLLTHPGHVAKEYLEGKRKKYFNPLTFLVISAAMHFFAISTSGYFTGMGTGENRRMPQLMKEAFEISNSNGKLLDLFLLVPLITIVGWLLFRRPKYNLAEHFVLQAFILGLGLNLRTFIFIPLFLLLPGLGSWHLMAFELTILVYLVIAYRQFFQQNIYLTILKTVLVMILYIILYWTCIIAYILLKNILF